MRAARIDRTPVPIPDGSTSLQDLIKFVSVLREIASGQLDRTTMKQLARDVLAEQGYRK